jgi:hypothetical protein
MIKSAFVALAAAPLFAGAAMAGPYVNVEANSGFAGSDYTGTTIDTHVGYEGALVSLLLGMFRVVLLHCSPDSGASETVPSGKAGLSAGY